MIDFMEFLHASQYTMEKRFEEREMFGVLPTDVTRWMMLRLTGSEDGGGPNAVF